MKGMVRHRIVDEYLLDDTVVAVVTPVCPKFREHSKARIFLKIGSDVSNFKRGGPLARDEFNEIGQEQTQAICKAICEGLDPPGKVFWSQKPSAFLGLVLDQREGWCMLDRSDSGSPDLFDPTVRLGRQGAQKGLAVNTIIAPSSRLKDLEGTSAERDARGLLDYLQGETSAIAGEPIHTID